MNTICGPGSLHHPAQSGCTTREFGRLRLQLLAVAFGIAPPTGQARPRTCRLGLLHARDPAGGKPAQPRFGEFYGAPTPTTATPAQCGHDGSIGWATPSPACRGRRRDLQQRDTRPIQQQVDTATWLPERYACSGNTPRPPTITRSADGPSLLMREIRLRHQPGPRRRHHRSFVPDTYRYHMRTSTSITAAPNTLNLPGSGSSGVHISGLATTPVLVIATGHHGQSRRSCARRKGHSHFSAPIGPPMDGAGAADRLTLYQKLRGLYQLRGRQTRGGYRLRGW